jgi:soluble lytic murein transglycosylase-like protein
MGYKDEAEKAAKITGVDPMLLLAIAGVESEGDPDARAGSKPGSASGLMQIGKVTWEDAIGNKKFGSKIAEYSNFADNWDDPLASFSVGAVALYIKGKSIGVPMDNPNYGALVLMAYNGGQTTVNSAISAARNAGEADPYAAALQEKYLKGAVEESGIYSYYMLGGGAQGNNPYVKDKKQVGTDEQMKEAAITLKYKEVSQYPAKFQDWQNRILNYKSGKGG